MSTQSLTPQERLCYIQNSLKGINDIAEASDAIAETIEELIKARADAESEQIRLINHDGIIGGLATAARILSEQQFVLICQVGEVVKEGQQ